MVLFLKVFLTEFIAEMGDKTQLMLIALTSKYKLKDIILGTAAAILVLNGLAVLAGGLVSEFIPEWLIKIVAAKKNEVDMALGNAVGSNVFNILMVLGIASAISPITIIRENIIDLCVLMVFTVCVWIFAATKKRIGKVEGFCMIALYVAYAIYIVIR